MFSGGISKSSFIFLDFQVIQQYSASKSSNIAVQQLNIIFLSQYGSFNSFLCYQKQQIPSDFCIREQNKTKRRFFSCHCFFLNLLGDFADRFFTLKVLWDTFGERTSALQCLTKHIPPSQFSQVRVRGQVALKREHMHMEESLPQQSSLLLEAFLTNQGRRPPEVFLKPFAIKLCNKAQVPIQAWQFCPLTTKGARITL